MVVKRSHTSANVAPAIRKLRAQVDEFYPERDRTSDGIWPSAAHTKANPNSDHEAGNAIDLDDDLAPGIAIDTVVDDLVESRDPRISYIIHAGRIWSPVLGWRRYNGANPHTTHAHVSIKEAKRDDDCAWRIGKPVHWTHAARRSFPLRFGPWSPNPMRGKQVYMNEKVVHTTRSRIGILGPMAKVKTSRGWVGWIPSKYLVRL